MCFLKGMETFLSENRRLICGINRLKKTGVVDVKNPVEAALEKGRFQELDDDSDREEL